jgi:DNA helicase INO80
LQFFFFVAELYVTAIQVQDIVVGSKNFTDVTKPSEIVQLLLNDDKLVGMDTSSTTRLSDQNNNETTVRTASEDDQFRDLWNEEGDDFFGQSGVAGSSSLNDTMEDEKAMGTGNARRKKGKNSLPGG